jgi:1,4-dihydroxy-2-naphthoate octaprenyltransferase
VIAAILSTNNACDRVGDARAGRRTLAIVLGPDEAHVPVFVLVAACYAAVALLLALRVLPPWALVPMGISAIHAWRSLSGMKARGWSHATKGANMGAISLVFLVFTACLLAGIALAGFSAGR